PPPAHPGPVSILLDPAVVRVLSVVMVTTLPTGSSPLSAAAMPVRTVTPEAVVAPLQYAVALNCRRAPGTGSVGSTGLALQGHTESIVVASYSNTNPVIATRVASSVRQFEREIVRRIRIRSRPHVSAAWTSAVVVIAS